MSCLLYEHKGAAESTFSNNLQHCRLRRWHATLFSLVTHQVLGILINVLKNIAQAYVLSRCVSIGLHNIDNHDTLYLYSTFLNTQRQIDNEQGWRWVS